MNQIKFTPHSNREDFEESWQAIDENGDAIDLTGATIVFSARHPKTCIEVLSATTSGGEIAISTTTFTISIGVDTMRALDPIEYNVGCTIELSGFTSQFFVGTLPIIDGVVP